MNRSPFSPSQLNLRYNCPGSVALGANRTPGDAVKSEAAERGTLLHELTRKIDVGDDDILSHKDMPEGDLEAVNWTVGQVRQIRMALTEKYHDIYEDAEVQVPLDSVGIESGEEGNRVDKLFFCTMATLPDSLLVIIDYKFGMGYVPPPKWNWQMKGYAFGGHVAFHPKQGVRVIVLQPEADEEDRYREYTFSAEEIAQIGTDIKAIVDRANEPDAPLAVGYWCNICKCRDVCPQHKGLILGMRMDLTVREHLLAISPADRGKLYGDLDRIKSWAENALGVCQGMAVEKGLEFAGFEVGPGKQSRSWTNDAAVMGRLNDIVNRGGIEKGLLVDPEQPKSVASVEKVVGKEPFKGQFGDLVLVAPGNRVLKPVKKKKAKK